MKRFFKRFRRNTDLWVGIVLTMIGNLIPTVISVTLLNRSAVTQQSLQVPIFFFLVVGAVSTGYAYIKRTVIPQQEAVDDLLINSYLLNAVNFVLLTSRFFPKTARDPYAHLRANVMLCDDHNNLYIAYTYNMHHEAEKNLIWKNGYGVCGAAAQFKKQLMVDLTLKHDLKTDLNLQYPSEQHEALTKSIKTVICTPLIDMKSGEVIGVLNVDSTKNLSELKWSQSKIYPEIMARLLDYANVITKIHTKS